MSPRQEVLFHFFLRLKFFLISGIESFTIFGPELVAISSALVSFFFAKQDEVCDFSAHFRKFFFNFLDFFVSFIFFSLWDELSKNDMSD
jgi:hypothetical protein